MVAEGRIALSASDGTRGTAGAHALLDEGALLMRRPHAFTATAETDGMLIVVDRPLFHRMIEEFPVIATRTRARITRRLERIAKDAEGALSRLGR